MNSRRFHRARYSALGGNNATSFGSLGAPFCTPGSAPTPPILLSGRRTIGSKGGSTHFARSLQIESRLDVPQPAASRSLHYARIHMKRSVIGLITAMTITASVGQAADLKIENSPQFSITCTGVLETRNGIYFFNREKPITGLTPDDEVACWGASILPNDKGCWPMRGKSIEQILAVCPIGKTCQVAGVLKNLTHGLYCWTEVNSVNAK